LTVQAVTSVCELQEQSRHFARIALTGFVEVSMESRISSVILYPNLVEVLKARPKGRALYNCIIRHSPTVTKVCSIVVGVVFTIL
jgi:hypothetical protein